MLSPQELLKWRMQWAQCPWNLASWNSISKDQDSWLGSPPKYYLVGIIMFPIHSPSWFPFFILRCSGSFRSNPFYMIAGPCCLHLYIFSPVLGKYHGIHLCFYNKETGVHCSLWTLKYHKQWEEIRLEFILQMCFSSSNQSGSFSKILPDLWNWVQAHRVWNPCVLYHSGFPRSSRGSLFNLPICEVERSLWFLPRSKPISFTFKVKKVKLSVPKHKNSLSKILAWQTQGYGHIFL